MLKYQKQNDYLLENQLRCKLVSKNLDMLNTPEYMRLSTTLNRLTSSNDPIILETFYLLELLTNLKPGLTFYRKNYQEVNIQMTSILRDSNIFYFLYIFKVFYFPILKRRNENISASFDKLGNATISVKMVNLLPIFPDLYYKWNYTLTLFFFNNKNNKLLSYLYLKNWCFRI